MSLRISILDAILTHLVLVSPILVVQIAFLADWTRQTLRSTVIAARAVTIETTMTTAMQASRLSGLPSSVSGLHCERRTDEPGAFET